jgi:hypothetical protein
MVINILKEERKNADLNVSFGEDFASGRQHVVVGRIEVVPKK